MQVKGLSDVFVASGVEMVDDVTFVAMLYGYNIRGKVRLPSAPTVEFFFYGKVYIESREHAMDFIGQYEEQFGHAKIRFSEKYVSNLLDIGGMEAPEVKERLGKIGSLMLANNFGATDTLPPDDPEPEPEPVAPPPSQKQGFFQRNQNSQPTPQMQNQPSMQRPGQPQMQRQGQPQMQRQGQPQMQRQGGQPPLQHMQQRPSKAKQPIYEEPKAPFEDYKVVSKLVQIFINGVNKTGANTFTTLFHGFNLVGKMLHPMKDDVQIVFYGQLMNNVTDEFEKLRMEMNQKYGKVPMRMIGGSCEIILLLEGKDAAVGKEMLGCVSGFMLKNNIAAANLPNTVGNVIQTYTAENFKPSGRPTGPRSLGGVSSPGQAPQQPDLLQ